MSIIDKVQRQDAVYWAPLAAGPSGQPTYAAPVGIRCRWETKQTEIIKADGSTGMANHALITSQLLALGGLVLLGTVPGLTRPRDPVGMGALVVQQVAATPNIKQTKVLYEAWL